MARDNFSLLELISQVAVAYESNPRFAKTLDTVLAQIRKAKANGLKKTQPKSQQNSIEGAYMAMVETVAKQMCDYLDMKKDQARAFKEAMYKIFKAGENKKWFKPRNAREGYNTITFLRSLYYMYSNGFLDGLKYCGADLTIDTLSHFIKGFPEDENDENCYISSITNENKLIKEYKCSSVATMIRTSTNFPEFEKFCSQLRP